MHKEQGPDGFTINFFQSCWDVVKRKISWRCSRSYITLGSLSKNSMPPWWCWLPIKQGHRMSRIIALLALWTRCIRLYQAFANRLSEVLGTIILKPQNAFVKDRQILDLVFIINEYLDGRLRSSDTGIVFKLNMEKAYDHVNWWFLLYLLGRCMLGERWCSWITHCLSTAWFSILVNGTPIGLSKCSYGLK